MARAQLLAAGSRGAAIGRAVRAGRLHRVHRGVYATVAPELLTEEGHLVAALLAAGEGALLSHGTAAWRWRIIPAPPSVITLAVPRRRTVCGPGAARQRPPARRRHHPQRPLPDHHRRAHPPRPRDPLRPPRPPACARGGRVPPRPASRRHRAHAAPRAPRQRQPACRARRAHAPGPRADEEPARAPLPRPAHPPRDRAAAAQRAGRPVDGRLPVARAPRRRRARRRASTSARTRPTPTTTATSGCAATATSARRYGKRQIDERPDDVIADLLDALGYAAAGVPLRLL